MVRRRVPPSGPDPGQQLAHPIQLADVAPPEAAQERPQGGGRLDHATESASVLPVRSTSAVNAVADATRVSILSPGFARPGASPRSTWLSTSSPSPRCWADKEQPHWPPGGGRRTWMSGCSDGSIFWVRFGSVWSLQNHYPRRALSYPFTTPPHLSFRWIGAWARQVPNRERTGYRR